MTYWLNYIVRGCPNLDEWYGFEDALDLKTNGKTIIQSRFTTYTIGGQSSFTDYVCLVPRRLTDFGIVFGAGGIR